MLNEKELQVLRENAKVHKKVFDKIKEIAKAIGYTGNKDHKERKLLYDLKKASKEFNNFCFFSTNRRLLSQPLNTCDLVFVDCREPEELKLFKEYWQEHFFSVFISREIETQFWGNPSDDGVQEFKYDYYFYNDIDPETLSPTKDLNKFIGIMERQIKQLRS